MSPNPLTRTLQWTGLALLGWYFVQLLQSLASLSFPQCPFNVLYVWILLGTGLLGLPFVYLFRNLKFSLSLPRMSPGVCRFLYVAVFGVVVVLLKNIDVTWANYKDSGLTVVVYTLCRFILMVYVFVWCVVLGSLALRKKLEALSDVLFSFFLGASIYGILVTCLGLVGLLHLWVGLLLTVPLLYWAPRVLEPVLENITQTWKRSFKEYSSLELGFYFLLGWFLLVGGGFFLFSNGLYPGPILNDEWEHYFHYYRTVLDHGSLMPNEVWYHFYVSKGAGLFFLSGLFSDFLSAQLVSTCFVIMTGLILYDLLKSITKDTLWAMGGALVFLTLYDGAFFRHHVVLTGYIAFFVWACIRLLENRKLYHRLFWAAVPFSVFYISFYLPPAAALTSVFFGLMAFITFCGKKTRAYSYSFFILLLATLLGVGVAMAVNYSFTGLAEMVPLKTFWRMADQDKFGRVFGEFCVRFFLLEQTHTSNIIGFKMLELSERLRWFKLVFRADSFKFIHLPVLSLLTVALISLKASTKNFFKNNERSFYWPLVFTVFLLSAFLISQVALIASTYRLFVFTAFFLAIIGMALLKTVAETFIMDSLKCLFSGFLCVLLCFSAIAQTAKGMDTTRVKSIASYFAGKQSFAGVLAEADRHFTSPASLRFFTKLREKIGPTARVLCLSYFPSPGYSFPGVGLVSEPSYRLSLHQSEIIEGTPERAKGLVL